MSRRDWALFVADMLEASGKINSYISGLSFEEFQADSRTVDAVVRNLEIIGEAARAIPVEMKQDRPAIDWSALNGLRNRIVHEYFGLSLPIIWAIVLHDLPVLDVQLRDWIKEHQ